jgi:hypothetical protein
VSARQAVWYVQLDQEGLSHDNSVYEDGCGRGLRLAVFMSEALHAHFILSSSHHTQSQVGVHAMQEVPSGRSSAAGAGRGCAENQW